MAVNSTFTPKASLTDAPTNLKEAIDWVLRVTGKDGKALSDDECICGLAAAVTDLLQSVQLEYHGYQGDVKNGTDSGDNKGATSDKVTEHLNGLFSLVQGLGGTAVVRTYIDQLAQVLSALVGWSKLEKCPKGSNECKNSSNKEHHGTNEKCQYLEDVKHENKCDTCGCMKWNVTDADREENGHHLGRGCTRCKDSGHTCKCTGTSGGAQCTGNECKCALAGKCCKCCCKGQCGKCSDKCSCIKEDKDKANGMNKRGRRIYNDSYQSAYSETVLKSFTGETTTAYRQPTWKDLIYLPDSVTPSQRRHQCAQTLLGSVCLIWSGLTYMYWTGKWAKGSPYWNNHILDGSGLDDGTLSQWLQALGFPREMLNNHGPGNRMDGIINNELMEKLFIGFKEPDENAAKDNWGNTARTPTSMNYPGFIHTIHRDSFHKGATVFRGSDPDQHKRGALFKLYILSCAYFTGLQKKTTSQSTTHSTPRNPKTIREILYWLSALPYSKAYPKILKHGKERLAEVLKKPGDTAPVSDNEHKELKFYQEKLWAPITVHEYNLFAHFQAVTQYCPLVLIGIQGGIHSTKSANEPAIHSLYANTECNFTYPTVSIQAYNQVVHYIRALFYQLYFLRKQCAVKVTCGGKWRECRYGKDVVSKGVISWMCLGCDPMEHDRKKRVENMGKGLKTVSLGKPDDVLEKLKAVLVAIGYVVVQLGNAQEALEGKKQDAIEGVKEALGTAKTGLEGAKEKLNGELQKAKTALEELTTKNGGGILKDSYWLKDAKDAIEKLTKNGGSGSGILGEVETKVGEVVGHGGLDKATSNDEYDPGKNKISEAINGVHEVLELLKKVVEGLKNKKLLNKESFSHVLALEVSLNEENALLDAINQLISLCNSPKCPGCTKHSDKCGKQPVPKYCDKCHQQYMDGTSSPLQAFLEDRLPGFSCKEVVNQEKELPDYPPAASHLGHCNGSGQCCPLPMGFRGQFQKRVTNTGQRLYGLLYFFSNGDMMQSCVYTLVRVTAALSATTPQVLGDVFGFFRGGVGEKERGKTKSGSVESCGHTKDPSNKGESDYFCGWCASGLREEVKKIEWVQSALGGKDYRTSVGAALIGIKGDKGDSAVPLSNPSTTTTSLSALTDGNHYVSPLTGELYTAVSATFGGTYLSWVLYLSDALEGGLRSLSEAFQQIECNACKGQCDPNKCKKGEHGQKADTKDSGLCQCSSIVSCTGVLPVLYRHGFSYGNPFNLEGYHQKDGKTDGDYSITDKDNKTVKHCHEFLESLNQVINAKKDSDQKDQDNKHPLTELLKQVGALQYDIRLPWIFVLAVAWLVAVLYLAFGAIWPLDWTHMRSHWLRGGEHQWQCMWYKVMTGRKGVELIEYFGRR